MKHIIYIFLFSILLMSCNKKEVEPITFNVTANQQNIHLGDTVKFNFSGNPYFITFFSGESGHKYENKERVFAEGVPGMSFTSYRQYGTHDSTLKLYVSPDFSGTYSAIGVNSATWINMTGKSVLSTGSDNTASGNIDLSNFINQDNKPIYVGYRYTESDTTVTLRTWTIKDFLVNTVLNDSSKIAVATLAGAGWKNVNLSNATNIWTITTSGTPQLKIAGGAAGSLKNDNMVISGALYLNKVTPDVGVAIKQISDRLDTYTYVFSKSGTYTVTFVAANEDVYGRNEVIKTLTITVN